MDDVVIKQVIVVRSDLHMRRDKLAEQAARASMQFLIDNNEADRGDQLTVKLSNDEATWLMSGSLTSVVACDSEDALRDMVFRAELADIEVHPINQQGTDEDDPDVLTCAAFGPTTSRELDRIVGGLKVA